MIVVIFLCRVCFFCFFFKQKTAYELRISDWSSDVCSSDLPKRRGEFVNTWSIDGFVGEGCQPAELGWGSHEKTMPADGKRHDFGCDAAIYLMRPGAGTRVRSWTPLAGPMQGFLVTHNEARKSAGWGQRGSVRVNLGG